MKKFFLFIFCLLSILCGYAEEQKTIAIVTYSYKGASSTPWDPDIIKQGVPGSEEAVIYISQQLAQLGYKVFVLGNPPQNSPYSSPNANPRYVPLGFEEDTHFDIAISWRMPDAAERLKKIANHTYFWPHDTYHWKLSAAQINGFDDVLWLSRYQRNQWCSVNPGFAKFTHIFGNGINPEVYSEVQERENPYSCIYGSNYARGLEILLDTWPVVQHKFPQATLDIYYGWNHWGLLSPAKEKRMKLQIEALALLGVREHGLVGHEELTKAYEKASFWTYPCTAPETFCITALRAQFAGAIPVIIQGTALQETVQHGYACSTPDEYLVTLLKAMEEVASSNIAKRTSMRDFIYKKYTWKQIASDWKALFESRVTHQKSTPSS